MGTPWSIAADSSTDFRERSMPLLGDSRFVGSGKPHSTVKPARRFASTLLMTLTSETPTLAFNFSLIVSNCLSVSFKADDTTTGAIDWLKYVMATYSLQIP